MFDSNAMAELAHIKRDRYERAGEGGAHRVQRRANAPLRPKANQQACEHGLFSDQSDQKEMDL